MPIPNRKDGKEKTLDEGNQKAESWLDNKVVDQKIVQNVSAVRKKRI